MVSLRIPEKVDNEKRNETDDYGKGRPPKTCKKEDQPNSYADKRKALSLAKGNRLLMRVSLFMGNDLMEVT